MWSRQLDSDTKTGPGTLTLLVQPIADFLRTVKKFVLRIDVEFTNSNVGAKTVQQETFCHESKVTLYYRDGTPWIQNVSWRGIELLNMAVREGYLSALRECIDKSVAGSATETETYYLEIPVELPTAERPEDFVTALAHVGKMDIKVASQTHATETDIKVSSFTVYLQGVGDESEKSIKLGTRQLIREQPTNGRVADQSALTGNKLVHSIAHTKNVSGAPIAMTGLDLKVDEGRSLVELPDLAVTQIQQFIGQSFVGAYGARSSHTLTNAALLFQPGFDWNMAELPQGEQVKYGYQSQPASTTGSQFYVTQELQPFTGKMVRGALPKGVPAAVAADAIDRQTARPGVANTELERFLPAKVDARQLESAAG